MMQKDSQLKCVLPKFLKITNHIRLLHKGKHHTYTYTTTETFTLVNRRWYSTSNDLIRASTKVSTNGPWHRPIHAYTRTLNSIFYSGAYIHYDQGRLYTEKICRLKSHRLCVILVDRLESRLNIMNLLIEEYDR